MRRRKTDDGLRKVMQGRHYIRIAIEPQQNELIAPEAATLFQHTLEIHLDCFPRALSDVST